MPQAITYRIRLPQVSSGRPATGAVHVAPLTLPDVAPQLDELLALEQSWPRPLVLRGAVGRALPWPVRVLTQEPPPPPDPPATVTRGNFLTQAIWGPQPMQPALRDLPLDALLDAPRDTAARGTLPAAQHAWAPRVLVANPEPWLTEERPAALRPINRVVTVTIPPTPPLVVPPVEPPLEALPALVRTTAVHVAAVVAPPVAVLVVAPVEPVLEAPPPQVTGGTVPAARHAWAPPLLLLGTEAPILDPAPFLARVVTGRGAATPPVTVAVVSTESLVVDASGVVSRGAGAPLPPRLLTAPPVEPFPETAAAILLAGAGTHVPVVAHVWAPPLFGTLAEWPLLDPARPFVLFVPPLPAGPSGPPALVWIEEARSFTWTEDARSFVSLEDARSFTSVMPMPVTVNTLRQGLDGSYENPIVAIDFKNLPQIAAGATLASIAVQPTASPVGLTVGVGTISGTQVTFSVTAPAATLPEVLFSITCKVTLSTGVTLWGYAQVLTVAVNK